MAKAMSPVPVLLVERMPLHAKKLLFPSNNQIPPALTKLCAWNRPVELGMEPKKMQWGLGRKAKQTKLFLEQRRYCCKHHPGSDRQHAVLGILLQEEKPETVLSFPPGMLLRCLNPLLCWI